MVAPMISVVLCTRDRASTLRKTLESLRQMLVPADLQWELVIVDNQSSDNTRDEIHAFAESSGLNVRYVWEPQTGKSHALNRGVREATGEIIAFTDDDVMVSPGWLRELMRTFHEFGCMGVGGRCIPAWEGLARPDWLVTTGPYRLSSGPILEFYFGDEAKEVPAAPWGLNMAFRRSAFETYGMFRTDLGPSGTSRILGEDTEFGRRLLRQGEKIFYAPKAIVHHPVHPQRITKNHFLQFYFNYGRALIREESWPAGAVFYFGIPRYMIRELFETCATWLFAFESQKRLYHKAHLYFLLGQMIESRASQKNSKSVAALGSSQRPC